MPRRRLFWRIYLYGLLLLVVIAGGVALMMRWSNDDQARSPLGGLQNFARQELAEDPQNPAAPVDLTKLHTLLLADAALYRSDGVLLQSTPADICPPDPLDADDTAQLFQSQQPMRYYTTGFHVAVSLSGDRYLILRWPAQHNHIWPLLGLAALLILSAVVLLPLAYSISRPLEKIASAAQALGQGDLSARTQLQRRDEIGLLARSFDDMAERLQALIRSEKELLANVSHELRTPLARLRVALALVEDDANDPGLILAYLPGIQEDVTQLQDLVDEVLTAARLALAQGSTPSLPIQRQPLSLCSLLQDTFDRCASQNPPPPLAPPKFPPDDIELSGDANLLSRLLKNLIENALKYASPSPEKPIHLSASLIAIDPANPTTFAHVALEVRDHGPGVEPALLARIFEPFFRADMARSDVPGSGLGLTLCKRIAEAHGGSIVCRPPPRRRSPHPRLAPHLANRTPSCASGVRGGRGSAPQTHTAPRGHHLGAVSFQRKIVFLTITSWGGQRSDRRRCWCCRRSPSFLGVGPWQPRRRARYGQSFRSRPSTLPQ